MEWISVNDRLPEIVDESCLVCSISGSEDGKGFPRGGYDFIYIPDYFGDITAGLDEKGNQLYTKWYLRQGITHWMPYPKLPTE